MKENYCSKEIYQNSDGGGDLSCLARRFTPLSYEAADGILQNVLRACGYEEAHMKICGAAL